MDLAEEDRLVSIATLIEPETDGVETPAADESEPVN